MNIIIPFTKLMTVFDDVLQGEVNFSIPTQMMNRAQCLLYVENPPITFGVKLVKDDIEIPYHSTLIENRLYLYEIPFLANALSFNLKADIPKRVSFLLKLLA